MVWFVEEVIRLESKRKLLEKSKKNIIITRGEEHFGNFNVFLNLFTIFDCHLFLRKINDKNSESVKLAVIPKSSDV